MKEIESLARQAFISKVAKSQVEKFSDEQKEQQEINQKIEAARQQFSNTFGSDLLEYIEKECKGKWRRNFAPSLSFQIKEVKIRLYYSYEEEWRWEDSRNNDSYSRLYGDLRESLFVKIGELLVK